MPVLPDLSPSNTNNGQSSGSQARRRTDLTVEIPPVLSPHREQHEQGLYPDGTRVRTSSGWDHFPGESSYASALSQQGDWFGDFQLSRPDANYIPHHRGEYGGSNTASRRSQVRAREVAAEHNRRITYRSIGVARRTQSLNAGNVEPSSSENRQRATASTSLSQGSSPTAQTQSSLWESLQALTIDPEIVDYEDGSSGYEHSFQYSSDEDEKAP